MIPAAQGHAATIAGHLAAEGRLDASALLPDLVAAARRAVPSLDPSGLRMRLAHAISDAETAHTAARARATRAIRRDVETAFALRRPRRAVLAAAAAADPAATLSLAERESIVLTALVHALGARR
jgi:hypothetical protein